jgi:N-acylneuraminate cytidylyltransferase
MIALIPARSKSKRIPNKNIKMLGGKPLMAWSIETARELGLETWVSTDSEEYANIAEQLGAHALMRPPELARDSSKDSDVVKHALWHVKAGLIVYLRPTTPFRDIEVVRGAMKWMEDDDETPLLRSCHRSPESFVKGCWLGDDGIWQRCTSWSDNPNQECPVSGWYNGYVDIVRKGEWDESNMHSYETPRVIELDEPEEWEFAEWKIEGKGR